jgi:hypothetical protein
VVAGQAGEPGTGATHPGIRPVRTCRGQAVGVDRDELAVVPEQHRPGPVGGDRHPPRPQPGKHAGRLAAGALDPGDRLSEWRVGTLAMMNPEEPIMPLSSQDRLRSTMKIKWTA